MAVVIARGTIVMANIADPRGNNPKTRPVVVVADYLDGDPDVFCVAVSTQVPDPLPPDQIPPR